MKKETRYAASTPGALPALGLGAVGNGRPGSRPPRPAQAGDPASRGSARSGPVVVMSCAYSGAGRVQDILAGGTELACTSGTGILPLCAAAGETWRRVEGTGGQPLSSLAISVVRGLIGAQVTVILAEAGKSRWCELATAGADAAGRFLQLYPQAAFVCVYRRCLEVVRAGIQANPWGLQGQALMPYLLTYPGNSVAALSAYWADAAEELLAFERANPGAVRRVRYEDVIAEPGRMRAAMRDWLGLNERQATCPERFDSPAPRSRERAPAAEVPAGMIPESLRLRISRLQAEIGYPPN